MTAVLAVHAVVAALAPFLARRIGGRVFYVCALGPLTAVVWIATLLPATLRGEQYSETYEWVPLLGLEWTFRIDAFSAVFALIVSGIGVLVFFYARWYFPLDAPRIGGFAAWLSTFAGAMLGLVTADNVLLIFVFWELTSISSFFLIGFENTKGAARASALRALLVTGLGGLALLMGLVMLSFAAGADSLAAILENPPESGVVTAALVLILVGAFTKSAQWPFHFWLPGAMAAPTPVSAYLHSATMVKAGVYLVARFAPAFAGDPAWRPLVFIIGSATAILGAVRALKQTDLKLLLAFGTVSALGLMITLFGAGEPKLVAAGLVFLIAHAIYKAALFMTVGVIDHQAHTRDLTELSWIGRRMPILAAGGLVAAASMAGIPLTLGFLAKEVGLAGWDASKLGLAEVMLAVSFVAALLTVAYSARFAWGAFAGKSPEPGGRLIGPRVPVPKPAFVAPILLLGVFTVGLGLVWPPVAEFVIDLTRSLAPESELAASDLSVKIGLPLLLSVTAILGGLVMFVWRSATARALDAVPRVPSGEDVYARLVAGLNWAADRTTAFVQPGSLPAYLGVILATVVLFPGGALLLRTSWPTSVELALNPAQAAAGALVIAAAIATAFVHRRFQAVILFGFAGFGVAVLFVIQGAPDLALTQFLVETLAVVVFVAVLRRIPLDFRRHTGPRWVRGAVAIAVGVVATAFVVIASEARTADPVGEQQAALAEPEAGGDNVVNVILVDFRALDTMGEIAVLAITGIGVASLIAAARADRRRGERSPGTAEVEPVEEESRR